ncbi:DNA-processing protein DprA [Faecalispora sporosphaeroides]|uniref:DNA-protecting protein DprA n=1 Tax=Faecalispora sporosphaeroides TaxID=1549 RepID=A0A928Q1B4_9FIRM|nr:DNA-processing protein DprA [Faecalispora sporosphaeroides]MBE6832004.1 DNA-protecting protein DprA [Faecalispora sporosphaeroides]
MSCETAFWVWLQHGLGAGSGKVRRVLSCCTGLREFWEAGPQFWELQGLFTARELSALRAFSPRDAQRIADRCEKSGIRLLTPEEEGYPRSLWEIANPPCVLYVKGQLPAVDEMPAIAVVGTRDATISGKKIAFSLSYQLARAGAVVISGGARGIDTAAHRGALQARGKTVCVLGCGLEHPYLMENAGLRDWIAESGAVISEYPPDSPASRAAFPIRNRIISGLSCGVLVVEAAAKSGSLITADLALEQGRDVFAVPCGIDNPVSRGVNTLIKNGAVPVGGAAELLEQYLDRFPGKIRMSGKENPDAPFAVIPERRPAQAVQPAAAKRKAPQKQKATAFSELISEDIPGLFSGLPGGAVAAAPSKSQPKQPLTAADASEDAVLLDSLLTAEAVHLAVLGRQSGLAPQRVLAALTELELLGRVRPLGGGRYCRS